jgi:hypothetical protein
MSKSGSVAGSIEWVNATDALRGILDTGKLKLWKSRDHGLQLMADEREYYKELYRYKGPYKHAALVADAKNLSYLSHIAADPKGKCRTALLVTRDKAIGHVINDKRYCRCPASVHVTHPIEWAAHSYLLSDQISEDLRAQTLGLRHSPVELLSQWEAGASNHMTKGGYRFSTSCLQSRAGTLVDLLMACRSPLRGFAEWLGQLAEQDLQDGSRSIWSSEIFEHFSEVLFFLVLAERQADDLDGALEQFFGLRAE